MEFLELLEQAQEFIPKEYAGVSALIDAWYPYLYLAVSAIVCFFGLKVHHIWLAFVFFVTGFLIGALSGVFFPKTWSVYIFIALGVLLGILLAKLSHKLHKLQLFVLNALMVMSALPPALQLVMPSKAALTASIAAAITVGFVAVKYKFIVTIITTSWMGATQASAAALHLLGIEGLAYEIAAITILTAAGMLVQFHFNKKHKEAVQV